MDILTPLVKQCIYPRVIKWVNCWNPISTSQSKRLAATVNEMLLFDNPHCQEAQNIVEAVQNRMKVAVHESMPLTTLTSSTVWRSQVPLSLSVSGALRSFAELLTARGVKLAQCFMEFCDIFHSTVLENIILDEILGVRLLPLFEKYRDKKLPMEQFVRLLPQAWVEVAPPCVKKLKLLLLT